MTIGDLSTIEAMVNVHKAGESTTLTGIFCALAAIETAVLTTSTSVAAMTRQASVNWLGSKLALM